MLSCAPYAQRMVQLQSLSDRSLLTLHRILQLLTSEVIVSLRFTHTPDVFRIPRFPRIVSFFIRSVLQVFRIVILRTLLYFFFQRCIHSSSMDSPIHAISSSSSIVPLSSSLTVVKNTSIFFWQEECRASIGSTYWLYIDSTHPALLQSCRSASAVTLRVIARVAARNLGSGHRRLT